MIEPQSINPAQEPFEANRWAMIITLLSMDVVIASADLMGLVLPDRKAFVATLRALILEMRREHEAGGPFYSAGRVADSLAAGLGLELCAHLTWWGNRIFERRTQDHLDLTVWSSTLRYCRHEPLRWEQLGLPPDVSSGALREFLRAIDATEYERRNAQIQAEPLSDWDLHMYALNGFDDEDEFAPSGPATYVYPTVMTYQGYRFWAWMLKHLDAEQQAALARSATLIAQSTESLKFLGTLPQPSALEIGL